MAKKSRAKAQPCTPPAPAVPIDESHFRLSEDGHNQLSDVRDLINTMAELAMGAGPNRRIELPAEALSTTLFLAARLMEPPMTFVSAYSHHHPEG